MKTFFSLLIYFLLGNSALAQVTYSGNVLDATDKSYLEGVTVSIKGREEKITTNSRGYFNLQASKGDTIQFSFPGFLSQKFALSDERFLTIQIQDRARLLPTFEVKAEPYSFRFKDGKLTLRDPNEPEPEDKSGEVTVGFDNPNGGATIYGAISYFTRKAKNAREYKKKQAWHARRTGYYEVIESDSIRKSLMVKHDLDRKKWDKIVIRFNEGNNDHQFLDWSSKQVYAKLDSFINQEKDWVY